MPPAAWNGTRDAVEYSNSCMQHPGPWLILSKPSEDCLYLNVWRPRKAKKLAAMIFFYGGSFEEGSAMFPLYSGEPAAGLADNTVFIACNYRLNVFGFLGGDGLRGSDNSTGNFGIADQRAAMRWVNENADALGIDVEQIMIFGESAGSASVSNHLVQKASWPYYTRAAMESGPPAADWIAMTMANANQNLKTVAAHLGCSDTAASLRSCLMTKNTTELFEAGRHLASHQLVTWAPVIDGVSLTAHPHELVQSGQIHHVPVLLGTNRDEGTTFTSIGLEENQTGFNEWVGREFGSLPGVNASVRDQIIQHYPCSEFVASKYGSACYNASSQAVGDYAMTCPARRAARWLSAPGGSPGVFLYYFRKELSLVPAIEWEQKKPMGVFHGSELALVFDFKPLLLTKEERALSVQTVSYWTTFAATGNPGTGATPHGNAGMQWPAYNATTDSVLAIDIPVAVEVGLKRERCDFWDAVGSL